MKTLLSFLLIIQMVWILTSCSCPCCKKPAEKTEQAQPAEGNSQPAQ